MYEAIKGEKTCNKNHELQQINKFIKGSYFFEFFFYKFDYIESNI